MIREELDLSDARGQLGKRRDSSHVGLYPGSSRMGSESVVEEQIREFAFEVISQGPPKLTICFLDVGFKTGEARIKLQDIGTRSLDRANPWLRK